MKNLRDLKDLTIHDAQHIGDESSKGRILNTIPLQPAVWSGQTPTASQGVGVGSGTAGFEGTFGGPDAENP